MLWMTIGGNAIPMGFNQLGKPSIRLQSLPFQAVLPSFKEGAGTALGSVIPELAEGFLEEVGGVQTPVGLEQFFSGARLPFRLRFLRRESKVYRWPLM